MPGKNVRLLTKIDDTDERVRARNAELDSETMLRTSHIVPRDIVPRLPDDVVDDLHERIDRTADRSIQEATFSLRRFENAVIERLFPLRDERRSLVRLRLHSHVTAIAATVVAAKVHLPVHAAYVGGWLHDSGIASCILHLDDDAIFQDALAHRALWKKILDSAPYHTVALATRWRLPSSIRYALREHVGWCNDTTVSPLSCALFVAEHLASLQSCGFSDEQPLVGLNARLRTLGLSERDLLPLARDVERRIGHLELEWRSLKFLRRD
jgi:hypothetical protein